MLAAVATRIAPEEPLAALEVREVPEPEPREGWEVIEVRAAALNHHDIWTLRGVGVQDDHLPVVLGCDAAGLTMDGREVVVHAVLGTPDPGVDPLHAEDRHLIGERGVPGTASERVAVPSANLVPKPAGLTFAEAACLPVAYLTAYRMLFTQAGLQPGDRVLIQGAGGGVSTAAIMLAVTAGLIVYVTSRSREKQARSVEMGARAAFDPGARLPERVDAVIETVGKATWGHSLRSLRMGGTVVVSGATTGSDAPAELNRVFWRQLRIVGSSMGTHEEFRKLCQFVESTDLSPLIDSEWALADAPSAFARLHSGEAFGKVVLLPTVDEGGLEAAVALAEEPAPATARIGWAPDPPPPDRLPGPPSW